MVSSPSIRVRQVQLFRVPARTRFPFRYGIAAMTEVSQLFVRVTTEVGGRTAIGISADCLPPKWFTKHPETRYEDDDLPNMLRVIRGAAQTATDMPPQKTLFEWWRELYAAQDQWARQHGIAPLLTNFGVSLIERAVIDATCRRLRTRLFDLLKSNLAEIDFAAVRPPLGSLQPRDVLPDAPLNAITLRHTVGMGDPLTDEDVDDATRVDDDLPLTLQQNIRAYGLQFFKIKLSGELDSDRRRLTRIAKIVADEVGAKARFTLDANEQFPDIDSFHEHFQACRQSQLLRDFFDQSLLLVEQPVHRASALGCSVRAGLKRWSDAPPIIIDESDGDLDSLPRALDLGYSGSSHKNCKGVFKGLINAATIHHARQHGRPAVLSAEDLVNVGPVALLQDLAVVAALGITHAERNGHHYLAGLSWLPAAEQDRVARHHGDLYQKVTGGFVALAPESGSLRVGSVVAAPFGYAEAPELSDFAVTE